MTSTPHGTDVVQKRCVFLSPQPVCSAGSGRYVAWLEGSIIGTFADLKIETWSAPQPISGIFAQAVPCRSILPWARFEVMDDAGPLPAQSRGFRPIGP